MLQMIILLGLQRKSEPGTFMSITQPFIRKALRIFRFAVFFFFISTIVVTIIYRFVPPPLTPLMVLRAGGHAVQGEKMKLAKDWVSLKKISPNMIQAVVASEDNNYLKHFGIDFDAVKKAREMNKRSRVLRGASTISQQTAKNVFLWPDRSWLRKGLEVYFTGLIEIFWGKRRIMEVYLNVIEMGDGIYGVEMASQLYFSKPAGKLTKAEAALIAAVLPNPRRWSPAAPTPYIQRKQQRIIRAMNRIEKVEF